MLNHPQTTYRAWTWTEKGESATLRIAEKALPKPGPGDVLVANRAIGLNPVDWKVIQRGHADWKPGHVPGVDGAGIIAAAGEGVHLPEGLRVAYHQRLLRDGSFAEYTLVRAESLLPIPAEMTDAVAASLPCPGLTAWQAFAKIPPEPDRDVLVTGAGGSVGLLLAQLAVGQGWRIWVTAAKAHHEGLKGLGIAGAFDYRDESWRTALQAALGPRRLFAAFDTVSGDHARSLAPMIGYNGHLVCIQDRLEAAPLPGFTTALSLHEVALNSVHAHATERDWREWRETGARLFRRVAVGNLRLPPIHVAGFDSLPEKLGLFKAQSLKGKVVVTV
ncbi:zinc-binding dehydrogenase [Rhizobiaceae bacterium BDR2-2]|uniref:Zinc-binding dehydrogenase n=1 Tax=Ectorhizobium quercum TaxID=2965071 RepID=A0AAE3N4J5_9HYPH|nr:zinc-binding dehydrogenase [Ectorhizobium quercum]MCX8999852.1 zinc-binding dehydrogenase [Ectorhizobium quercum]